MRKRFFVLFGILLIFSTMFIPVFADEPSQEFNLFASFQFDYVDSGSEVYAWPGNIVRPNSSTNQGSFLVDAHSNNVYVEFYLESNQLTFGSSNFLLYSQAVGLFTSPYDNVKFTSIVITGNLITWERDSVSRRYFAEASSFSISSSFEGASSVDVGSMLRTKFANQLAAGYVYIQNLQIKLSFYSDDTNPAIIDFRSTLLPTDPTYVSWINVQNTGYQIVYNDASDLNPQWLLDFVNAFLEFQIAPDLTFNSIFKIVLVVGIFFWVLTLTI